MCRPWIGLRARLSVTMKVTVRGKLGMSAVNSQFSIAVHILASIGRMHRQVGSAEIAASVNANPSFVRRVLAKLVKANLVRTTVGKSGCCCLTRDPIRISLLDIYNAVEPPKPFVIHNYPKNQSCIVSCGIKGAMGKVLEDTEKTVKESLRHKTLAEVIGNLLHHA